MMRVSFERPINPVWYDKMRRFQLKPVVPFVEWDDYAYNGFTERVALASSASVFDASIEERLAVSG
jgi:hypothetical protein